MDECILTPIPREIFQRWPALKQLSEQYNVLFLDEFEKDPETFYEKIKVLLVGPLKNIKLTDEFLGKLPNLKVVATNSTGFSHLDIPLIRRFNLKISRALGSATAETVADHGFLLIMMAGRRVMEHLEAGQICTQDNDLDIENLLGMMGCDIHHSTLGIVGMGMIGFEIAQRAKGFKMQVFYHNRHRRKDDGEVDAMYCPSLEGLLPKVDFLMMTPPLTEDTRGMIRRDQLKLMKPTSIIINVSRGPIIVTEDLVEALKDGAIGGAALDVIDPEPLPTDHPLRLMSNVILTPHVALYTRTGSHRATSMVAENVRAAMAGTPMPGELPTSEDLPII